MSMERLTLDELILKGTHNSYACQAARPPCMNHPPDRQIDDFGVWSLELDYSLEHYRGGPTPVVGHGGPGDRSCWGHLLSEHIDLILQARALQYRPVFVYLEVKRWRRRRRRPRHEPDDRRFGFREKWEAGLDVFRRACSDRLVLLDRWIVEHGRWPYPLELAGKVVLYEPNLRAADSGLIGLRGTHASRCVTPERVETAIETGLALERSGSFCKGGARALRLDQYQADWTFAYGVPPNPLVVDPKAATSTVVDDAQGKRWRCGGEVSHGEHVSEQGTYRFPFTSLEKAIERARGITASTHGQPDPRRAGYGWTVLLKGDDAQAHIEQGRAIDTGGLTLAIRPYSEAP